MHLPTRMFYPVKTNPKVQQCRGPIMETPAGAPAGELLGACWQRHRTTWNGSLRGRLQFTKWWYLVLFPVFPIYRILFGYIYIYIYASSKLLWHLVTWSDSDMKWYIRVIRPVAHQLTPDHPSRMAGSSGLSLGYGWFFNMFSITFPKTVEQ